MISPPENVEIIKFKKYIFWFDADGILCAKSLTRHPANLNEIKEVIDYFIERLHGKKVCILNDFSNISETNKEIRDYVNAEYPKIALAVAIISKSPLGKMMANLYFNLKHHSFPARIFTNEKEAKEWLEKYLKEG